MIWFLKITRVKEMSEFRKKFDPRKLISSVLFNGNKWYVRIWKSLRDFPLL